MTLDLTDQRWPGKPTHRERRHVLDALDSRDWTSSFHTETVEQKMRQITGAGYCVAFNSCTSAIHAALAATYGVKPTTRLTTTPLTFVGTVTGAGHLGLTFDYLDVNPDTLNMCRYPDYESGPVIAVDLHGVPHELDRTRVITDACQSLGTLMDGRHIGAHGTHAWSFSASKLVAAPDGGAITTNDGDYAARLRLLRDYGVTDGMLFSGRSNGLVHRPEGHNWRPSELSMALVSEKLDDLTYGHGGTGALADRANTAGERLHQAAADAGLWHQQAPAGARVAWHKVRIGPPDWMVNPLTPHTAALMRDQLRNQGVPCHVWGRYPLNEHPAYRTGLTRPVGPPPFPVATRASRSTFCLGTEESPPWTWTRDELEQVSEILVKVGKAFT